MKTIIKYLLLYVVDILFCTLIFVGLCRYIRVGILSILFYRGCFFILICGIMTMLFLRIIGEKIKMLEIGWKDYMAVCSIFVGVTITWFTLGPVTVERSVSVYMLSYMDQNSETLINIDDMGEAFEKQYVGEFGAFDKRFNEQILSGNMEEKDDGYIITPRGRRVVNAFRILADVFDTEKWLVYPNNY